MPHIGPVIMRSLGVVPRSVSESLPSRAARYIRCCSSPRPTANIHNACLSCQIYIYIYIYIYVLVMIINNNSNTNDNNNYNNNDNNNKHNNIKLNASKG